MINKLIEGIMNRNSVYCLLFFMLALKVLFINNFKIKHA